MTTLAIVGGGIVGRSLAYALAKEQKKYSKILLFQSEAFAFPCSVHSTAIVAPRGVTRGHSPLGDLILSGLEVFSDHVKSDSPVGVYPIIQYTGAKGELEKFRSRYPHAAVKSVIADMRLKEELYVAEDDAYLIDPKEYLEWLLVSAQKSQSLDVVMEFVTAVEKQDSYQLKTIQGNVYEADEVVMTVGAQSRFWKRAIASSTKLQSSKPVHGAYLEFGADLGHKSFSTTIDGENIVYHAHTKKLLLGSTSSDSALEFPSEAKLKKIYQSLTSAFVANFPVFEEGIFRVGLREKASKREPYIASEHGLHFIGGLYKNGYTLSLKMAQTMVPRLLTL